MEKININLPAACYNVEKILGVSLGQGNQKNYKVQWTPTWVSELYLLGCDKLIKQFLNEGGETNTDIPEQKSPEQIKEEDNDEEEEESPSHENETTPDVDISSALNEINCDDRQDTTSNESAEVRLNNDTASEEIVTTNTQTANEDILLGDIKEEPEEESATEEMVVGADDVKVEETEQCLSTEVEDIPTNHNIPENFTTESEETESSDTFSQPVHADVNMSNRSKTNHDTFNINGENYHFGQYLKEKDVTCNLPTSSSTDWKKMRKQVFTYEDVSAYPSYPETHTITADKPKPTKQLFSRKRPISHEISTSVKCPNNGVQNINNIHFSQQQSSICKSSKTNQQNVEVYVATPMTLITAPMAENENIHTNSASIVSSMDTQTNSGIAFIHSVKTSSIDSTLQLSNSRGPCVTNTRKQNVVDLTDDEDTCTFTKYTSGASSSHSFRITGMHNQMNNFSDPGGPGLSMTSSASSGCNSFVPIASSECDSFVPTMTSRNEPSVSTKVNVSRSSQLAHVGGGDGSQNPLESQAMNSFHQQTSNTAGPWLNPAVLNCQQWNRTIHDAHSSLVDFCTNQETETVIIFDSRFNNQPSVNSQFRIPECIETSTVESETPEHIETSPVENDALPTFCGVEELNGKYFCNHCNASFSSEALFKVHNETHDKRFQCSVCFKRYETKLKCQQHEIERHNINQPLECEVCGFQVRGGISNLRVHIRRKHTMERPFKCSQCPKECSTSTDLKKHVRIHTGERPFTCSFCLLTFNTSSHMSNHVKRVHTTEREYKCSLCVKEFPTSHDLKKHTRRRHSKDTSFECSVCLQTFKSNLSLKKHVNKCVVSTANV